MRKAVATLVLMAALGCSLASAAQRIVVRVAPPAPRKEVMVARPGADFVWVGGFWRWEGNRHVWVDGHWVKARPGHDWVPGHWKKVRGGWEWVEGHWRRR